jgi:hypothetical protein
MIGVEPFSLTQRQEALNPLGRAPQTARNKSSNRYNNLLESSISLTTSNNMYGSLYDQAILERNTEEVGCLDQEDECRLPMQLRSTPIDLLRLREGAQSQNNLILTTSESPSLISDTPQDDRSTPHAYDHALEDDDDSCVPSDLISPSYFYSNEHPQ